MAQRKVAVELELEVARYNAGASDAATVTRVVKAVVHELGEEADQTSRDMDQLAANTDIAARQVDDLGDEALGTAADLAVLERQAKQTARANAALAASSGAAGAADLGRRRGVDFSNTWSEARGMVLVGLAGLIAVAAPALGAMISGAVVGTVTGGGIVGGIVAAAFDPRVQAAAKDLGQTIKGNFLEAGEPFVAPVQAAIRKLSSDFLNLNIGATLAKAAPSVERFAQGISDLVTNIMPGFNRVLDSASPLTDVFADGLANIGDAISDMLTDMMESDGTIMGLNTLMMATADVIRTTGTVIKWLSDAFHDLTSFTAAASGALEDVYGYTHKLFEAFPVLGPMTGWVAQKFADLNDRTEGLLGVGTDLEKNFRSIGAATVLMNKGLDPFAAYLEHAAAAAAELNVQLRELFAADLQVDKATIAYEASIDALTQSFKDNGKTLDVNTEKGRENREAVLTAIEAAMAMRDANIANGMSVNDANKLYMDQVAAIEKVGAKAKVSKDQLDKLAGKYDIAVIVTTTFKQKGQAPRLHYGAGSGAYMDAPDVRQTVELSGSGSYTNPHAGQQYDGRAAGGPVLAGPTYRINEQRLEGYASFSQPGVVWPLAPGAGPMVAGGGGGTTGRLEVVLCAAPGADEGVMAEIIKGIRYEVRTTTGDVQQVLGP